MQGPALALAALVAFTGTAAVNQGSRFLASERFRIGTPKCRRNSKRTEPAYRTGVPAAVSIENCLEQYIRQAVAVAVGRELGVGTRVEPHVEP